MDKKKNKLGDFKIIKVIDEGFVRLDIEMDDALTISLIDYAFTNMNPREKDDLLINWAFNDIIKKQIELVKKGA